MQRKLIWKPSTLLFTPRQLPIVVGWIWAACIIWIWLWQLFHSRPLSTIVFMQPFSLGLFIFCTFVNFHFHKSRSRYRKRDDRGHWAKAMLMKASLIIELSAGVVTIQIYSGFKMLQMSPHIKHYTLYRKMN